MYKNYIFGIALAAMLTAHHAFAQNKLFTYREWEDEKIVHINLEKPHAAFTTYQNVSDALKDDFSKSTQYKLLNGDWKFHHVNQPAQRPLDFHQANFDDSQWKTIKATLGTWAFNYPIAASIKNYRRQQKVIKSV